MLKEKCVCEKCLNLVDADKINLADVTIRFPDIFHSSNGSGDPEAGFGFTQKNVRICDSCAQDILDKGVI